MVIINNQRIIAKRIKQMYDTEVNPSDISRIEGKGTIEVYTVKHEKRIFLAEHDEELTGFVIRVIDLSSK